MTTLPPWSLNLIILNSNKKRKKEGMRENREGKIFFWDK